MAINQKENLAWVEDAGGKARAKEKPKGEPCSRRNAPWVVAQVSPWTTTPPAMVTLAEFFQTGLFTASILAIAHLLHRFFHPPHGTWPTLVTSPDRI